MIDGDGAKWWDGEGSNGGKTKPKFFYAHSMTNSLIDGLNVKNTPVQGFSINGASNLTLNEITIDNSAGDGSNGGNVLKEASELFTDCRQVITQMPSTWVPVMVSPFLVPMSRIRTTALP